MEVFLVSVTIKLGCDVGEQGLGVWIDASRLLVVVVMGSSMSLLGE